MTTPDNGYITLTDFKKYLTISDTDTTDDALLQGFIERASRGIDAYCGREFYPERETKYFDTPTGRCLDMSGDDCLEIFSITNGSEGTLSATDYKTYPYSDTPFYEIRLKPTSTYYWSSDTDSSTMAAIQVDAIWGYCMDYDGAWRNITTIANALTDSATSAVLTAELSFVSGELMKIGSEIMLVTACDTAGATIQRAYNGTTAAAHDTSGIVYKFAFEQTVVQATLLQATRYWKRKDAPFGVAGAGQLGQIVSIGTIDPDIQMLLFSVRRMM